MKVTFVVVGILAISVGAGTWNEAFGQNNRAQWLAVAGGETGGAARVSVAARRETGLEILVTSPGVLASEISASDGNQYTQLRLVGGGATAEQVGFPEMPFKGFFLEVPYGVEVSVELQNKTSISLGTGYKVYPLQPPLPDNDDHRRRAFHIDQSAYAKESLFPSAPVIMSGPGFIRGRRVVFIQVFPLQYNPITTELRAFASLRLAVNYKGLANPAGQTRKKRLATDKSESLAKDLILNYTPADLGGAFQDGGAQEPPPGPGADYLIIVADQLYEEILPLAQWKHKKGYITQVVKMSDVGDLAVDVMDYIQTAYDNWAPAPSYVLLVGDNEDVPPDEYLGDLESITDQPYSCLDGDDYYPDVVLGRLPVHTEAECTNVVNKILQYDRTPDSGDWYDNFLAAGYFEDTENSTGDGEADRWFMETTMTIYDFMVNQQGWDGYTALCTTYWPLKFSTFHFLSESYPHREAINLVRWGVSPYPDPVPSWIVNLWTSASQATADVTAAINAGVGLVQHRDHGGETLWGAPPYNVNNINSLANGVKTPVVFSINCSTGSFYYSEGDCFCEAFLKKNPGGCVGIAGATRTSYSGPNDLLAHGIYTCFWPSYDPTHTATAYPHSWRPAEALLYGKYYMLTYYGVNYITEGEFNMFHWFGDPEMNLRTATPESLSVNHPSSVIYGHPVDVNVAVNAAGAPLADALVAISHPAGQDHWKGVTDANGAVAFSQIKFSELSDYNLVVSTQNSVPYEADISVSLSSSGVIELERGYYSCSDTVSVQVADLDLQGQGILNGPVTLSTDGGDTETVTLNENPAGSGVFSTSIQTMEGPASSEDGTLQVAHGQTITASYNDDDDGTGSAALAQDTALVDCQPPIISNIQVSELTPRTAVVTFDTDELATARIQCDTSCGEPYAIDKQSLIWQTSHRFTLHGLSELTDYFFIVEATDVAGNKAADDNGGLCHTFTTLELPDYITELFDAADNDLDNRMLILTPDGSVSFYSACTDSISALPTDPTGGTVLTLVDDDAKQVNLTDGASVSLYGTSYTSFYVGSNGYITFTEKDYNYYETLKTHFAIPRISVLFDDFNPANGGTISVKQLGNRVAVTWQDVPQYGYSDTNTFQAEMYFNGQIVLAWMGIAAEDGLAGLSEGNGRPTYFDESNLSEYQSCGPPDQATDPDPANESTGVPAGVLLSWTGGRRAMSHDVYFGTTSPGAFQGNRAETTFNPDITSLNTTYYWRIDEVNATGKTTGEVWSFISFLPDFDGDGDVDQEDFGHLQVCFTQPGQAHPDPNCEVADLDGDNDIDWYDFTLFQPCLGGPNVIITPGSGCD